MALMIRFMADDKLCAKALEYLDEVIRRKLVRGLVSAEVHVEEDGEEHLLNGIVVCPITSAERADSNAVVFCESLPGLGLPTPVQSGHIGIDIRIQGHFGPPKL